MGWLYTDYGRKLSHKEKREEMDKLHNWESENKKFVVLASTIKNNVYYGAIECIDKETGERAVTCAIDLIGERKEGWSYWFGYKSGDESMGVYAYDCPNKILDLLTPTDNEWANEWRNKCREFNGLPKLSTLDVGTVIEFECPFDTNYFAKGETVRLEKKCRRVNWRTGKKSYSWVAKDCIKWKTTMIPKVFKIVEINS